MYSVVVIIITIVDVVVIIIFIITSNNNKNVNGEFKDSLQEYSGDSSNCSLRKRLTKGHLAKDVYFNNKRNFLPRQCSMTLPHKELQESILR